MAVEAMACRDLRRARNAKYVVGNRAWLHNLRRKQCLTPKLQSPYTVEQSLFDMTYWIKGGARGRCLVVHVDRL